MPGPAEETLPMFWTYDAAALPAPAGGRPLVLPVVDCAAEPCTRLVASWNATLPPGTVFTPAVRVYVAGRWSRWYPLARWGHGPHPATGEVLPRSLPARRDDPGPAWVDIDTLRLKDS